MDTEFSLTRLFNGWIDDLQARVDADTPEPREEQTTPRELPPGGVTPVDEQGHAVPHELRSGDDADRAARTLNELSHAADQLPVAAASALGGAIATPIDRGAQHLRFGVDLARHAVWAVRWEADMLGQMGSQLAHGHAFDLRSRVEMPEPLSDTFIGWREGLPSLIHEGEASALELALRETPVVSAGLGLRHLYQTCTGPEALRHCSWQLGALSTGVATGAFLMNRVGSPSKVTPNATPRVDPHVVTLHPEIEVPSRPLRSGESFLPSYEALHAQLSQAPRLNHAEAAGPVLGRGVDSTAFIYRPDPTRAYKFSHDPKALALDITPEAMRAMAYEGVTLKRLQAAQLRVAEAHGLVIVDTGQGLSVGLMTQHVPDALNLKELRKASFASNRQQQRPLWEGYMADHRDAVSRKTLDDLDATTDAMLTRGFIIRDRQELLQTSTQHAWLIDPGSLAPWSPQLSPLLLSEDLALRNALADLIGAPKRPMPAVGGIVFKPWWDGDLDAVRPWQWK